MAAVDCAQQFTGELFVWPHLTRGGRMPPDMSGNMHMLVSNGIRVLTAAPADAPDAQLSYQTLIRDSAACSGVQSEISCTQA
jgi:hypothetical protein